MATKTAVKPAKSVASVPISKPGHKIQVIDTKRRIAINNESHEVIVDGIAINVAPKEFKIASLLSSSSKTFSRADILRTVWGSEAAKTMSERTVDQHVARLRKKITAAGIRGAEVIKTQNSFGYVYKPI